MSFPDHGLKTDRLTAPLPQNPRCQHRGWKWASHGLLVAGCLLGAMGNAQANGICEAELGARMTAIAQQPLLHRARLGILVETQGRTPAERRVLYAQDADQFFIPASNAKLLTSAAALAFLGPDYRIRTSVYGVENTSNRAGEVGLTALRVVGRGDPTLTDQNLDTLAQQLKRHSIQVVPLLVGDDSYFPGAATHPNWEWEDVQAGYGAPVNSLILNGNAHGLTLMPQAVGDPLQVLWDDPAQAGQWRIENRSRTVATHEPEYVTVGRDLGQPVLYVDGQLAAGSDPETAAIALLDPAHQFVQQFQAALMRQGISVGQTALSTTPIPIDRPEVAWIESPPLAELLIPTNRNSNNLYAESLLKTLGVRYTPTRPDQATAAGVAAATAILTDLGLDPSSFVLADGSGLSRHNLVTPRALVDILQIMADHPHATPYRESLSVAGSSGTLRNRLKGTPLEGRLSGKTGAMSGHVTLSGYLLLPTGQPVIVSILINNSDQRASRLRQVIDDLLLLLAEVRPC